MSFTPWQPPQAGDFPQFDPSQEDLTRQYGVYPSELESKPEGYRASPADAPQKLQEQGWWKCPTQKDTHGKPCDFWLNPQAHQAIKNSSGYVSCPKCKLSHDLLRDELPWHGAETESDYDEPGGHTHVGIPMTDQGQIAENLVAEMGEIPGYGRISWWHPGGAGMQSALDGAVGDANNGWGIEVKGIAYDAAAHKFDPGRENRENPQQYFQEKNKAAQEMGLQGILGILVMLDFRRDVADIYAKPMPLSGWQSKRGPRYGVAAFHKDTAERLVAEVPFKSPYKDPNNPSPGPFSMDEYYATPPVQMPPGMEPPASDSEDWLHQSKWEHDDISPGQINDLRQAAERAWGDDTRHEGFVGHPDPSQGHCFVTSQWLAHKLGGHVGMKNGHYFWVSPDRSHIMDLTGDWFSHPPSDPTIAGQVEHELDEPGTMDSRLNNWRPGPAMYKRADHPMWKGFRIMDDYPEHPRAKLFERRANATLRKQSFRFPGDITESPGLENDLVPNTLPPYVYRTMSEDHFQKSLREGFHQSDERNNYPGQAADDPDWVGPAEAEGTVAGRWAYPGYLPSSGQGRIVKIRTEPEDQWEMHPDDEEGGYWRTFNPIPTERFHSWTAPMNLQDVWNAKANPLTPEYTKVADLAGPTPYTGETPQQQEDWNFSAPLIHDEPHWDVASGDHRYQWIMANNHVQVSPVHSMDEMANHAQFDTSSTGPFAAGFVDVKDGHATWSVSTNMSLHSLSNTLEQYSETVGWKFDGLVDPQGQEIDDDFGARKSMWYTERKDGHLVMSESPLPHGKRIDIRGKTAHIEVDMFGLHHWTEAPEVTALREWANDFGYRLAGRGDRVWDEDDLDLLGGPQPVQGYPHIPDRFDHIEQGIESDPRAPSGWYPTAMYHIAPTEQRDRIRAHGLMGSDPTLRNPWLAVDEAIDARSDSEHSNPSGVYMAPTYELNNQLAMDEEFMHPRDVWRVNVPALYKQNPERFLRDPKMTGSFVYQGDVPSDHVDLYHPWENEDVVWPQKKAEWPGGGDATDLMKTREHLDMFNRGDMKFQPERDNPDLDIENADLTCSKCGQPFDSLNALRLHYRDHEPHQEEVDQNKFPWPHDFDDPLGFGTEPIPQMAWDGVTSSLWFKPRPEPRALDSWGKGLFNPRTQELHTWPELEGNHDEIAAIHGWRKPITLDIAPDGTVHPRELTTPEQDEAIQTCDPRLFVHPRVVSMVLPNQKIAERYPRFNQQGWDVSDAELRYYGAYHRGQVIGYAAVNPYGYIAALDALRPEATQSILRLIQSHYEKGLVMPWNNSQRTLLARLGMVCKDDGMWKWSKGQEPKDLIEAPIPFVYDVKGTKEHQMGMISLGYPGQSTHEVMPRGGEKFTPGGIVEGLYQPGGKVLFISHTNVPYTTRQFAQLWYALYPQMELTSVEHQMPDGSTQKLAAESVGSYLKTLVSSDQAAYNAYQALRAAGGKLYVVGGAIRDALQQRQPKDLDLMVAGIPTEQVAHVLDSLPGSVDLTGKRFGVYRYRTNGQEVEIALPREDKYETSRRGLGTITVDHNLPVEQDLARRDFTINSMAVDLDSGQLIDPHHGSNDLGNNRLRATHEDSFREDPTRLVRALTAHSRFGVHPDEHTRQAMAQSAHLLRHESPDALNQTLDKLFTSEHPASAIRLAKETGVLNHLFPEVANQWDFDQNNSHHAQLLGDHLNNVLDRVSRLTTDPDIRMAALFHDIGKPASEWRDDNGTSHYYQNEKGEGAYHETVGAKMAEDRMRSLNYPVARINRVKALIQNHMWPAFNSPKGARRFLRNYGQHADDLLTLRDADMYGKGYEPSVVEETRTPVAQMRELVDQSRKEQEPTDLQNMFINGNDLIAMGMQPGPQVGVVLRRLLDHVVENPQDNNRDRLLQLAKGYVAALPE